MTQPENQQRGLPIDSRGEGIPPQVVNRFHEKSDRDSSKFAQHHTLGVQANQASPGDHNHDGANSKRILEGVTLTGSRQNNAALLSVINALVALGATNNTTAT